jgi:GntR family transcriptional regulator/MocR family aminotransferase
VIYVGTFSKTLFPGLRLGFLVIPTNLVEDVRAARSASAMHPQVFDQAALADLIRDGLYDRNLRRMLAAYRERSQALSEALHTYCAEWVRLRPVSAGLHAIADLAGPDANHVFEEAPALGVELMPLSAYYTQRTEAPNALVLGFASSDSASLYRGARRLALAIRAAQR